MIDLILAEYSVFGPTSKDGRVVFAEIKNASSLKFGSRTIVSFKKILFPNGIKKNPDEEKKIALVGLHACDIAALDIFYKQFSQFDLLPERKSILVIASECKPDKDCFCDVFRADKLRKFDLYLQKEGDDSAVFSGSANGISVLNKLGLKKPPKQVEIKKIEIKTENIKAKKLLEFVENRSGNEDFWQGIANNCFGCGACTLVCPLCFCTRQNYSNNLAGENSECLSWDSCFAADFFKISAGCDFKPKNVDRLYNWYHHKFVRSEREIGETLCVGCGRCIKACPADLNIKNILASLESKNEE